MVTKGNNLYVTFVIKLFGMKERLIQLLDLEQLSPSKFADIIGVQRSSISHIISGRNKPSFDFLQKTLRAFPGLNASWLLMGEGTMYEQMGRKVSGNLFDTAAEEEVPAEGHIPETNGPEVVISTGEGTVPAAPGEQIPAESSVSEIDKEEMLEKDSVTDKDIPGKKQIIQVMILYEDDTFKTFMPSH